jgi:hypothetical protein
MQALSMSRIATLEANVLLSRYSLYVLYWYKSANTDEAEGAKRALDAQAGTVELYWCKITNANAFLVQRYKY